MDTINKLLLELEGLSPCFQVGPHKHTQMDGLITATNIRFYQAFISMEITV